MKDRRFEVNRQFTDTPGLGPNSIQMHMLTDGERVHILTLTEESARKLAASLTGVLLGGKESDTN